MNHLFRKALNDKEFHIKAFGLYMILVLFFLFFLTKNLYRSEASFVIKTIDSSKEHEVGVPIFGLTGTSSKQDSEILIEYLTTPDTLDIIDKRLSLSDHFASFETGISERLWPWSTKEEKLALYRKRLNVFCDENGSIIHIQFDSSKRELSQKVVTELLSQGQIFLNNMNQNKAYRKTIFSKKLMQSNKKKLNQTISELEKFQTSHSLVDPLSDVGVQSTILADLEGKKVAKRVELNNRLKFMRNDSVEVSALRNEIEEIENSIAQIRGHLVGTDKEHLNSLSFGYEKIKQELNFATKAYEQAYLQYQLAKIEAEKEAKFFQIVSHPTIPDGHVAPVRLRFITIAAFIFWAILKILQLSVAIIDEHQD
ncbi:hypothetical protein [Desulfobaculum bizertense]|uniref:Polysaccharide export inner-membrane protein, BexC/CtrB/KpsE family n=1 Tax=Desulfobaculum bizertense DSM 18034 TaxID=1121442 RepID=A0A1T4VYU1_9BACT|nr:hypothetical protein [Desulfobaculum bizertense]SKA70184.1 polysaccharide export inner-membrane protein, BexC/CtrB/KpsE family [Desulfobaculum bizertense DSM 18034]